MDLYGFVCTCEACVTMTNPTCAVHCLAGTCPESIMLPYSVTRNCIELDQLHFEWRCLTCGKIADAAEHTRILATEPKLIGNVVPQSFDEVTLYCVAACCTNVTTSCFGHLTKSAAKLLVLRLPKSKWGAVSARVGSGLEMPHC